MGSALPEEIANGATLIGSEYGWGLTKFPSALDRAEELGYACLGGQFQVRQDSAIFEIYWIEANSTDRHEGEAWKLYCQRSCADVRESFERAVIATDFTKEAAGWPNLRAATSRGIDLRDWTVFVAYFVNEIEWMDLAKRAVANNRRF